MRSTIEFASGKLNIIYFYTRLLNMSDT